VRLVVGGGVVMEGEEEEKERVWLMGRRVRRLREEGGKHHVYCNLRSGSASSVGDMRRICSYRKSGVAHLERVRASLVAGEAAGDVCGDAGWFDYEGGLYCTILIHPTRETMHVPYLSRSFVRRR
jgi:hypothetical protein